MPSVLFVCLGNICRSPMAEAVFAELAPDWQVDSAGTSAWHIGEPPDRRTVATCQKHGVAVAHRGRQVTPADFNRFDYIFAMDDENLSNLQAIRPSQASAELALLGDFDPEGEREVGDPYYGGPEGFERIYEHITRSCEAFLAQI